MNPLETRMKAPVTMGRRVARCSLLAATLASFALWQMSIFAYAGYIGSTRGIALYSGQLEVLWPARTNPGGIPFNFAGREGWNFQFRASP